MNFDKTTGNRGFRRRAAGTTLKKEINCESGNELEFNVAQRVVFGCLLARSFVLVSSHRDGRANGITVPKTSRDRW